MGQGRREGDTRSGRALAPVPVSLPDAFDLLALHATNPRRYPFLLETTTAVVAVDDKGDEEGDDKADAWDLLFAFPGETLCLGADWTLQGPGSDPASRPDFLEALDRWWQATSPGAGFGNQDQAAWPPFTGGWFLFLGYELALQIEPGLAAAAGRGPSSQEPGHTPIAFATRVPVAVARNRRLGQAWVVAEPAHRHRVDEVLADLRQAADLDPARAEARGLLATAIHEPDPAFFRQSVDEVRRLIAAGEVYQVNLSRRWQADLRNGVAPADIHRRLRQSNPAPFAGIATCGDGTLVSSSPERLARWRGGRVETRPIAGTVPRGSDPGAEEALRRALLAHPKERAEHIMLIDLERNDLGRVCTPGSVVVDEYMVVESYAHVHHIVSNISGQLRDDVTPGELIRAIFPGGTITGCPKVRCMEIVAGLEPVPRGPYTGSMGYLNLDGSGDLNILIRSFVIRGTQLSFAAGSGIVADSDPQHELDETRAKARGLLLALGNTLPGSA